MRLARRRSPCALRTIVGLTIAALATPGARAGSGSFLGVFDSSPLGTGADIASPSPLPSSGPLAATPDAQREPPGEAYRVRTWPLDAGTTAILVEDHRVPLVRLQIVFPAGSWSPWVRRIHAEEAFGILNYDPAGTLRARADKLSAGLYVGMGERESEIYLTCLKEDLPRAFELARDVLANRDFDRHELARRQKSRQIGWSASQKEPFFRAAQASARTLFAESDPRRRRWEKPEPLEKNVARLAEACDALVRLPGRLVAVAGDLTREELDRAWSGLLPAVREEKPADLAPRFEPLVPAALRVKEVSIPIPRLTQVYFGYGRDSMTYTDPDYPAFVVADHVLGGHFYSRLEVALRHEGGETYGAGTQSYGDVAPGPYGLGTFTRAPNAKLTEQKLREVLRIFHESGITEKERSDAVDYLKGRRPFERQSPDAVLGRFLSERRLGLKPGFYDELVDRAALVPLDEINRFIARYYDPALFSMIRVVPR